MQQILKAALLAAILSTASGHARAQALYDSPSAAADALVSAVATGDEDGLRKILGPDFRRFVPQDSIAREDVYAFLSAWHDHSEVAQTAPGRAALLVGRQDWSFPVPLVQKAGGWRFDLREGLAEMRSRRIERNESAAIETLQMLCAAQDRYRADFGHPAARIVSHEGRTDGLYWDADAAAQTSPLGEEALVMTPGTPAAEAWHGYHFAARPQMGSDGCAFTAWPATRGQTGARSFGIGSDRQVRELANAK